MQNLPFKHICRLRILIFMRFCTFGRMKSIKLTKFRTPIIAKSTILELLDSLKVISRKLQATEKS